MKMADCLYECLREARLEHYYPKLEAQGITMAETLSKLTMNDYSSLGISSLEDKKRLFRLIQIIKAVQAPSRSLGQGQSRQQASQRPPHNKESTNDTSTSRQESKNTHRSHNAERTEAQHTSQESNKENVGASKPSLKIPTRTVVKGAGTPETKPRSVTKSVPSPAKSDVSVNSSKGLNSVSQDTPGKPAGPAFIERIVHNTGYNYGLPNSAAKPKTTLVTPSLSADQTNSESDDTKIKVCVRKRPLSKREIQKKDGDVVRIENRHTIVLVEPKVAVDLTKFTQEHAFIYDEVFHESMTNKEVYEKTAKHLIKCVFSGGMATCFVYGQTGAGKTHTIMGNLQVPGLYLLAAQDIFNKVSSGLEDVDVTICVSYFEIYCGQLFDLLNKRKRLQVREDGSQRVNIAGLSEVQLDNVQALMEAVQHGNKVRSTGASGVNPDSSRSHAVLQIELRNSKKQRIGKISFIDLAGSERAADVTDTDKQNRLEGAEINQSLLALKECIRALDQESRHTPFRQSKLTHILKDSFIGNCRTCMIANISPCQSASENTLNTLRYADRVKELRKELSPKTTPREDTAPISKLAVVKEFPAVGKMTPSVFHPSSVPLSSTPLRPNKVQNAQFDPTERETGYSQFESPICGHKIRPRKLVNALTAEEDKQLPVKKSPRKVCKKAVAEKETVDLNVSLNSDRGASKGVSRLGGKKDSAAGKISDSKFDSDKPMDISTSSVNMSTDSRTSQASRVSRKSEKPNDKVRNPSSDSAEPNNVLHVGAEMLKPKQGDGVYMDSPLNLSVLKQGKFDKQTGLIARLEKAMEKTREALNRSLTNHDLMAASEIEKDDVLLRGDEAPQLSERQVEIKVNSKSKSNNNSKDTGVEKSPILVEKFSKSGVLNHPVKSFMQAAKNSPVTKEKMAKLVHAQKETAEKVCSVKKVSRTPTKMIERPMPDPKVMESKPDREPDADTSQEVSPSKRRRVVSPPEPQPKTSTDFDHYLAQALHDTGNKRNKFQVYDSKFLPCLQDVADSTDARPEKPSEIMKKPPGDVDVLIEKEVSTGAELIPGKDQIDGLSKNQNISSDSQTKSPNVIKRSLLSEFRETVVIGMNPKSPVTKTFVSPRKMHGGIGQDIISSSSPIKKFNSERQRQQPTVHTTSDENGKYDRSTASSGFNISGDKTLTENTKVNGIEKSPDMRRPKLLDRDTGDLYTMSQSPQKSPRMAAKLSPRVPKPALGQLSEASKKISSLPTPDEFLKSLAGKKSSVRKSRVEKPDTEPKSERLDRPKFKDDVEPKSESGAVKKDRAKWERPPEHFEPRNSRLLARNQRPTWIKPEATKRLSLTKMLDNPSSESRIELENDRTELIQNFYSKLLKYTSKDYVLNHKNSDSWDKSNDVCSTVSDSAFLKERMPPGGKPNGNRVTEFSEKIPAVSKSKTVTDSGVVIPRLSLDYKKTTETESDIETASIGTLDDVSSIASVRSLPANEQLAEDTRQIVSEPLPPLPPVDLQKTACSAWKKTAPVKPKPIKPNAALEVSPKKGIKKVTCTAPVRSEKLDPLSSFLPIHPYPVTPSSNDVLTAPKVITKIVVEDDSKDKTGISENLDDSEIVRTLDNAASHQDTANRDNLVKSLSTIGKALQQSKIGVVKELSKTTNRSRVNRNNADPLSKTIGYSSYRDSGGVGKTEARTENVRNHDSSRSSNETSKSGKSFADKDPLRNTIGVSSGKFLTNGDQLSSRSSRDSYRWRDPDFYRTDRHSDKVDLNPALERSFEARQQLGESLRSTYDSVKLRSTLNCITMPGDGSTLRETTIGYHSRQSTVEYKSDTEGGKSNSQSHHARMRVISGHEEHLADVTAMCRREMSLLKQVRSGEVSFSDYSNRMTDMLLIKLKSIELLRDRISRCKVIS